MSLQDASAGGRRLGLAIWLTAVVALVVFVRLRALPIPLERDEGEYAYMGQLMLDGVPPYKAAYNMKLPGTYAAYAGIMGVLGETDRGIHLGFLLVNLGSIALMYLIARRLLKGDGAVMATMAFALLTASGGVLGLEGHATHLVTFFALAGIWFWQRAQASGRNLSLFLSGLFFGVAFVCKQPGLFLGFWGAAMTLRAEVDVRTRRWAVVAGRLGLFGLGWSLPFGVTCWLIWRSGTFERFWFWTFTYARAHAALLPPALIRDGFAAFWSDAGSVRYALGLAVVGLVCLWRRPDRNDRRFFVLTLGGLSLAAFCGGFYFYRHYLIVMLPAVSLLIAVAFETFEEGLRERWGQPGWWAATGFAVLAAMFILSNGAVWFWLGPEAACRALYGAEPFPEAKEIARYIAVRTPADARIAVFGSEPEIFFYAHRRSASGYIYMYDLVQLHSFAHAMQREMIAQVKAANPEYLVMVNMASSWWIWPGAETTAQDFGVDLARRAYDVEAAAYIYPDHTEYAWSREALKKRLDTRDVILICRRKGAT